MKMIQYASLILMTAVANLASASQDQVSKQLVAEVLGQPIYLKDLEPQARGNQQQGQALDAETKLQRNREQLRGLIWGSVFRDYSESKKVEPTEEEVESLYLRVHAETAGNANDRHEKEVAAYQKRIQEEKEKIAQYQNELRDPDLSPDRKKSLEEGLDEEEKLLERDQALLDYFQSEKYEKARKQSGRKAAMGMASHWKLNQTLYQEYGGRIIFQQFGWEPIDAYRQLVDSYRDAGKFRIHDRSFDGAAYSYFDHRFVYADKDQGDFYFEKPWWQRTEQELKASKFMGP